jgi:hypothetical protein
MDKLPIDLVRCIMDYLEPDISLVIHSLKKGTYKQWITQETRYLYYEYGPKYNIQVMDYLGPARNYKELVGFFKGQIRSKNWIYLESFNDYHCDFLEVLVVVVILYVIIFQ